MPKRPTVTITKTFDVPAAKIFDVWLDVEIVGRWMFKTDLIEDEILTLETNPTEGGTFSFVVLRNEEKLNHRGTYREITRPNRLVFTWGVNEEAGDESIVTIEIEPTDNGCRLTLVHEMDPKWEEYTERTQKGWSTMLEKLNRVLK